MRGKQVALRRRVWRATIVFVSALGLASAGLGMATASAEDPPVEPVCVPPICVPDLPYGTDPLQKLDAYPVAAGLAPVVVVVHGGGWFNGSKEGVAPLAVELSENGFAVFNINYRLAVGPPGGPDSVDGIPMQTDDLDLAVQWIIANGVQYGADVANINLIGGSSGAQLVALAGQLINLAAPGTIRSVVEMSGPMDFDTMVHPDGPDSINLSIGDGMPAYLGCPVADCSEGQLRGPSPLSNIHPTNPAFMLVNGDAEMNPTQQATIFHGALVAAGESSTLIIVTGNAGMKHGFSLYPSQEAEIVAFLRTTPTDDRFFTVSDTSLTEGNSGTKLMTFTVTLTGVSAAGPAMVNYATGDGTASSGSDYVAESGTLNFPAGPSPRTQNVTVAINGDATVETDETLLLTLSTPVNATIADAQAQGTILTDDAGDPSAPTVTKKSPAADSTGLAVGVNVKATFSEPVNGVSAANFTLTTADGTSVPAVVTYSASTRAATLDPTAKLAADTRYTVSLFGGATAIRDAAGNALASTTWTFVTGPKPKVTTKTPKSGATAVSRSTNVLVAFNEPVDAVSSTTFTLISAAGTVTAVVSRDGTTNRWVLNPNAILAANTTYTVTVTGGPTAIRDLAGNPLLTTTWSFTTGA